MGKGFPKLEQIIETYQQSNKKNVPVIKPVAGNSSDDSSSDEEEAPTPQGKKPAVALTNGKGNAGKAKAQKSSSEDSSSEEESAPAVKKPEPKAKKAESSSEDSSEDEKPAAKTNANKPVQKKAKEVYKKIYKYNQYRSDLKRNIYIFI